MEAVVIPVGALHGAAVVKFVDEVNADEPREQTVCTCHSWFIAGANPVAVKEVPEVEPVVHVGAPTARY